MKYKFENEVPPFLFEPVKHLNSCAITDAFSSQVHFLTEKSRQITSSPSLTLIDNCRM